MRRVVLHSFERTERDGAVPVREPDCLSEHGQEELVRLLVRALQANPAAIDALARREPPRPTVATACSGCDTPILSARAIGEALGRVGSGCGIRWSPDHKFSCENARAKNIFLRDVFATHIPKLFEDCRCFKGAEGKCFIAGGGKRQPIDAVQYMFMGFPCKDVSSLNTNQRKHRDAIAQGKWCQAEKTGGVFVHGVLPYVTNHGSQLRALILENVLGLLIGNLYALACNM